MKEQAKPGSSKHQWTILLFVIYLIGLLWILLLKLGIQFSYMKNRRVNLVPFNEPSILAAENILNVIVFVPLGIYAGVLFKRWTTSKKLVFVFLVSFLVEALQYLLRLGAFDITDIVTNTLGGIVGMVLFKVIDKAFENKARMQQIINVTAATATVIMLVLLVLLKLNMLPVRYQ